MSVSLFRILRFDSLASRLPCTKIWSRASSEIRKFHNGPVLMSFKGSSDKITKNSDDEPKSVPLSFSTKYKIFDDSDSKIIVDTLEENHADQIEEIKFDEFEGINLTRGLTGVFEIEELVDILHRENAKDIFVAVVPTECRFVEYICIVSSRSNRHMLAVAEFIRRVFKKKCNPGENIPHIEGKKSKDWMALDLGNIALHIFSDKARMEYDLEQLWSVGPNFDSHSQPSDNDLLKLLEKHSIKYLDDLKPMEDK